MVGWFVREFELMDFVRLFYYNTINPTTVRKINAPTRTYAQHNTANKSTTVGTGCSWYQQQMAPEGYAENCNTVFASCLGREKNAAWHSLSQRIKTKEILHLPERNRAGWLILVLCCYWSVFFPPSSFLREGLQWLICCLHYFPHGPFLLCSTGCFTFRHTISSSCSFHMNHHNAG